MKSREWKQVREVFADALRRDPEERGEFIDQACAGKPWLRAEVAALLDAHVRAGDFSETPSFEEAADAPGNDRDQTIEGRGVGPYIIRQEIGRGGMGVVYLADDTRLARRVALKALAPGLSRQLGGRERLRREARAAAGLSHPGIATVYALEEIGDELYLACEYVPGLGLRALLEAGPLPIVQVVEIGVQLARALTVAHMHGVVHRDLKPENVIRTPSGIVKVLDFGLARVEGVGATRLTQTGSIVGTPAYMAPEQALGRNIDHRTDLFSFGLLLYEMASGTNPFAAGTVTATIARIIEIQPAPLSEVRPDCMPELDRIVAICLRKDPAERYTATEEVLADLERLQEELSVSRHRSPSGRVSAEDARSSPRLTPRWWWEFHQALVSAVYALMILPAWRVQSFRFCSVLGSRRPGNREGPSGVRHAAGHRFHRRGDRRLRHRTCDSEGRVSRNDGRYFCSGQAGVAACPRSAGYGANVLRVVSSVNASDSRGMLVTNGPMSHPKPIGMPRVREIDSHCT